MLVNDGYNMEKLTMDRVGLRKSNAGDLCVGDTTKNKVK